MTSISAAFSSTSYSPLQRLQQELQSEVSAGTVSSNDQTALSSALTDIDSSLKGGQNSGQSITGHPPSPGDIGSKIDDLISKEVSNGKLTSDQATELQNLFAKTFAGGQGSQSGEGAAEPASGPPPGPPPSEGSSSSTGGFSIADLLSSANNSSTAGSSSTDSSSSSEGSSSTKATSDVSTILKDFLKLLQDSQAPATTYGASGSTSASLSALLVNYQT